MDFVIFVFFFWIMSKYKDINNLVRQLFSNEIYGP